MLRKPKYVSPGEEAAQKARKEQNNRQKSEINAKKIRNEINAQREANKFIESETPERKAALIDLIRKMANTNSRINTSKQYYNEGDPEFEEIRSDPTLLAAYTQKAREQEYEGLSPVDKVLKEAFNTKKTKDLKDEREFQDKVAKEKLNRFEELLNTKRGQELLKRYPDIKAISNNNAKHISEILSLQDFHEASGKTEELMKKAGLSGNNAKISIENAEELIKGKQISNIVAAKKAKKAKKNNKTRKNITTQSLGLGLGNTSSTNTAPTLRRKNKNTKIILNEYSGYGKEKDNVNV